ncbi:glycosyltransferase family 2 protein [Microbacterium thalassium]|uniref:Glycosyltransferase involved in cell wall biosynthesis n=1 Tax=Microbacterium thalassium TaxID=362649 RepID=A0A7X0KUD6_9MICO|nr:glycosyltransferase family 2 protein [Microbacterium thalassium]MBB6391066.1 glycosyltransferase involved in cell wall biosynthesis [Microbacterium thalassium]GLK23824.1 beta 1,4 glucosyltransferase [Microbacterium thalassium]
MTSTPAPSTTPAKGRSATLPISVIVFTKNEEETIGNTLSHLGVFDDIAVVDSLSTDRTGAIARAAGARVVDFDWNGEYPKKKQWSLLHAGTKHRWILLLDADEYPSPEMIDELQDLLPELESGRYAAYEMHLRYRFVGKFLEHGHRVTKRSLIDSQHSAFPEIDDLYAPGIREIELHFQPQADGPIGMMKTRLVHDDRDPVASWFTRHNFYADWEAALHMHPEARRDLATKRTAKGAFWDRVPLKPLVFFVYSYIARLGFLDGRAGFDYAFGLSSYYWQIGVKVRELKRMAADAA